jgi:hypothetical protein
MTVRLVRDVAVALVAFLVAGVLVGVLWPQLVDPVVVERAELGMLTDEVALGDRFDAVGWYSLLGGGFALLLGIALLARRQINEVVTVLAVLAGACLAAWLSAQLGTALGPEDPDKVLAGAEIGATAEERVVLTADVAYLVWPISAMIGAVVVLWSRPGRRPQEEPGSHPAAGQDVDRHDVRP